jgi:hypothetical protein
MPARGLVDHHRKARLLRQWRDAADDVPGGPRRGRRFGHYGPLRADRDGQRLEVEPPGHGHHRAHQPPVHRRDQRLEQALGRDAQSGRCLVAERVRARVVRVRVQRVGDLLPGK